MVEIPGEPQSLVEVLLRLLRGRGDLGAALAAAFAAGLTSVFICASSIGCIGALASVPVQSAPSSIASSGTKIVDCASGSRSPAINPAASMASTSGLRTNMVASSQRCARSVRRRCAPGLSICDGKIYR
jgi:hypothetical protein